jgi:enoyl-CoA hydratase/carnithine racemase
VPEDRFLEISIEEELALISVDRPPLNILSFSHYHKLCEKIVQLMETKEIKVVILTGSNNFFISGADIGDISEVKTPEQCEKETLKMKFFFQQIEDLKRPVIAAINGNCFGGGLELAMSCHLRLASKGAKLGLPEINLGTIPSFGGTQRLPRIVGRAKGIELILSGKLISAEEAYRIGLINEICASEDLISRAKTIGHEIGEKGSFAIEAAIQAMNEGLKGDIEQGMKLESRLSSRLIETVDMKEGISAFFERRKPVFRNS